MMKNFTSYRSLSSVLALASVALTLCAQSFTVHFKNGNTQTFNHADVDCISFSPDSYEPGGNETFTFSEPANTYIVSRAGDYEFFTNLPSGKAIEGVADVDWIWAQKADPADTEQHLLSDVNYSDGKVSFTATGNYGNAALAAFDSEGKVIWVWLLWMTPKPEEKSLEGGATILDRFMGATGATKEDGKKAWGAVVYQWGRPVPIFAGFEDEWDSEGETFNEARKWTVMTPAYGLEWTVEKKCATLEESIAAPTTFFTGNPVGTWQSDTDYTLWGSEKTDLDPSPAGYRIPDGDKWGDNYVDIIKVEADQSGAYYTFEGSTSWFPAGNQNRLYDTGENVVGSPGYMCWNASVVIDDYLGVLDNPNMQQYTLEELIDMGLIDRFVSRLSISCVNDPDIYTFKETKAKANPSFALPVRCVKIK